MKRREYSEFQKYYIMNLLDRTSDNKVEEVHFNTALLSVDDGGALCDRRIMTIKNIIVKKSNHEHDIIWKEVSDLVDEGLAMELEEEAGEDFRRIRSHVMNEVKEEEKYEQLEFDFDEDLVAPI